MLADNANESEQGADNHNQKDLQEFIAVVVVGNNLY